MQHSSEQILEWAINTQYDMLYRLALNKVRINIDAEDIVQDAFLKLCENINKEFENLENVKAWLIRVTINLCNRYWRNKWNNSTIFVDEFLISIFISNDPSDDKDLLFTIISSLPAKYSVILALFYYEEMTIKEISKKLQIKSETVRTRLARGRALVKKSLANETEF